MKNLLPILALLLLVGCTSEPTPPTELERCIKANLPELTLTDEEVIEEKWEIAYAIFDYKADERDQELEAWHSSETTRLSQTTMEEVEANPSMYDDVQAEHKKKLDVNKKLWNKEFNEFTESVQSEEYKLKTIQEYYGPEKTKEREKVAEKICNAQGIY